MSKDTTKNGAIQEKNLFSFSDVLPDKKIQVDFNVPDLSSVCQRVGQIMCGYEDANDCDRLRHDSALKMSVGRKASDPDLCSQPTMTRLENHLDKKTLWAIAELFVKDYMSSFDKAPRKIILDVDDTTSNCVVPRGISNVTMLTYAVTTASSTKPSHGHTSRG